MSCTSAPWIHNQRDGFAPALCAIALLISVVRAEGERPSLPTAPVQSADPIAAEAVELPPQQSDQGEPPEDAEAGEIRKVATLFPNSDLDLTTAKLSLDCTLLSQRGIRYQIDRNSESTWRILAIPTGPSVVVAEPGEQRVEIGRAWLGERGLQFAWADSGGSPVQIADGLRRAVLVAAATDGSKHAVALRGCIQWSPMTLDMTRNPARVDLPGIGLPGDIDLMVGIDRIESSGSGFQTSDSTAPNRPADRASAKRADTAQTEIELRLRRQGNDFTLETRCYYVDPTGTRRPFEAGGVVRTLKQKKRQLEKARSSLSKAKDALPRLRRSLSSSKSRKSDNPREQQAIYQQTRKLQAAVKRAESLIRKNQKAIPKIAEAIKQTEAIANIGRGLHGRAKVHARIFAVTGALRIPLVRIGEAT